MNRFWSITISVLFFFTAGCCSQKNTSKKNETKHHQKTDTSKAGSDTMPTPTPPPPGLAPGHAKINGKIISISQAEGNPESRILTIKINRVLGYGSSTPPMTNNDSIQVESTNLQQNDIQIGKFVTAVLSYQLVLIESGSSSRWVLVKLEK